MDYPGLENTRKLGDGCLANTSFRNSATLYIIPACEINLRTRCFRARTTYPGKVFAGNRLTFLEREREREGQISPTFSRADAF